MDLAATVPHSVSSDGRLTTEDDLPETIESALERTAVIIPVRNEEASLGRVLDDLPNVACVIVANNGSTDQSVSIALAAGCEVAHEPTPGYGRACLAGLKKLGSVCEETSIDYVAFVDGDYSDHVHLLGRLIEPLAEDEADFVLGSRMLGQRERGAMPFQALMGNRLACFLMWLIWRAPYTDLGPFRVIRRKHLESLRMQDQNFGWTVEMQVKATMSGLRTLEIAVPYRQRIGVSKISGTITGTFRAGYKILFTIAKFAWQTRFGRDKQVTE